MSRKSSGCRHGGSPERRFEVSGMPRRGGCRPCRASTRIKKMPPHGIRDGMHPVLSHRLPLQRRRHPHHHSQEYFFLKRALMEWLALTALKVYEETAPTLTPSTCTVDIP